MKKKIVKLYNEVSERIEKLHIACFKEMNKPLFLISDTYPGVWLEHVYDSIFYAKRNPKRIEIAKNTVDLFIDNQKSDGQLPFYVLDGNKINKPIEDLVGYSHIQECVSFYKLCYMLYEMSNDQNVIEKAYESGKKWINWLQNNRMTTNRGLIEMFCGYDTGHDNSGRLEGLANKGLYKKDRIIQNARVVPDNDDIIPILAVDMNCNYYSDLMSLSKMAQKLGKSENALDFKNQAQKVKQNLFKFCFNEKECFFYDVDKNSNQRKYLSSTIFHLFMENVLDTEQDKELIDNIYHKHIKNQNEFWTEYPFPSMAVCDLSSKRHIMPNSWGYYSQGLIALRCTMWMDNYGWSGDFDELCKKWVYALTENYDTNQFGQEIDPHTGVPTKCSQWYSSSMLFYLYAVDRLKLI